MKADRNHADDRLSPAQSAILCGLVAASLLAAPLALPSTPRNPGEPVALVFAPWLSPEAAFDRALAAGYRVLRAGSAPFVVIAVADGAGAGSSGLFATLALAGLAGCLDPERASEARS